MFDYFLNDLLQSSREDKHFNALAGCSSQARLDPITELNQSLLNLAIRDDVKKLTNCKSKEILVDALIDEKFVRLFPPLPRMKST